MVEEGEGECLYKINHTKEDMDRHRAGDKGKVHQNNNRICSIGNEKGRATRGAGACNM